MLLTKKFGIILIWAFLQAVSVNAQESSNKLEGRVFSTTNDVTGVHVSNTTRNRGTITDFDGYFEIAVQLGDTIVFSAVQFKRREMVVTPEILNNALFLVPLEDALTKLNEVVVMPYNLSGDMNLDMNKLKTGPVITASSENLLNAEVKSPTRSQRKLYAARTWDFQIGFGFKVNVDPLFNFFSGRTKMLNQRIAREAQSKWIEEVRSYYPDSLYIKELKIPINNVGDFIYSCEKDSLFELTAKNGDRLQLWEVLKKMSIEYLKDNE